MRAFLTLQQQARDLGHEQGWSHANFCEAYGWAEHGGGHPTDETPSQLTKYLLANEEFQGDPARFELLCLEAYGEFVCGFQEGIEEFLAHCESENTG